MGGENDLCACGYCRLDAHRIQVVRQRVGLDWHWRRADHRHRQPSRDIGIAADDDLVTWSGAHRPKRQLKRIKSVPDADAMVRPAVIRECVLKRFDLRTTDVAARRQ